MNELTRLSIWRPLLILMVILALVVLGLRSYLLMPVENMPQIELGVVSVIVVYPGASPEDVEKLIVKPIEDATSSIAGIDHVQSVAQEGMSLTTLRFREGTDPGQATIDVERQLAAIRAQLPEGAQDPTILKIDMGTMPVVELALSGPQSEAELFELADQTIKPRLQAIPGVASVEVSGGRERAVLVELDAAKMAAYGVGVQQVSAALAMENLTVPAGSLTVGRQTTAFRSVGRLTSVDDVANIVVAGKPSAFDLGSYLSAMTGAAPEPQVNRLVTLRDVASVREGFKEQTQILRLNGREGVGLSVVKAGDANALRVASEIRAEIKDLEKTLPAGTQIEVILDISQYTRMAVNAVQEDLVLAVLITGLVLLLFLHMWRSTIIVLLAIPTSLISSFLVMWALGFTLNILTLLAMALTVGILVDDAIVVLENIVRHLSQGESPWQAALNGRAEIGLAAVAITLADVVVYVPVAFTSGLVGQEFRSYGLTIAAVVLFSLFISFTLTPMLASRWLRREEETRSLWGRFGRAWDRSFDRLADWYGRLLGWCVRSHLHRALVIVVAIASLAGALAMMPFMGIETSPQEDTGLFRVTVTMPPGTSLETTDAVVRRAERIIVEEVPEATTILSRIGAANDIMALFSGTAGGSSSGNITVLLRDKADRRRSLFQIMAELRPRLNTIPEAGFQLMALDAYGTSDVALDIQVIGPDLETVNELAAQVAEAVRGVPGAVDVMNIQGERAPEVSAVLDRQRVSDLGLSASEVGAALRTALAGSEVGAIAPPDGNEVDIVLRASQADREDVSRLARVPLGFLNDQPITLDQVAHVEQGLAPAQLQRLDRQRYLSVQADVQGRSVGRTTDDIMAAIQDRVTLPAGYRVQMGVQTEMQEEALLELTTALALSIVLLYMLLVALYESFSHPLAIMFSQPVAAVGVLGALLLTGKTINMISMLGMILLVGIVTKNAILVVDFTNILRRERGMPREKALVEAGRLRLRPILMTTFTIVFAMLPVALRTGAGAEILTSMAVVVIGGALSSLLLTLVLVPTVYTYLDGLGGFFNRTIGRRLVPVQAEGAGVPASQPGPVLPTGVAPVAEVPPTPAE
jgi:HAE1 family hydrophobic/amphiphilic exporter-1